MKDEVLCTLDLIYETGDSAEPGCISVKILHPTQDAKLLITVEEKTGRNPLFYLRNITDVICSEMLNRVQIDLKKDVILYLMGRNGVIDHYGTRYVKAFYDGDMLCLEGADTIE